MKTRTKVVIAAVGSIILLFSLIVAAASYYYFDTYRENTYRENRAPLVVKQLPQKNPTSYTFYGSPEELREKILTGLNNYDYSDAFPLKIPREPTGLDGVQNSYFYKCLADNEGCLGVNDREVEEIFADPRNQNDIVLADDGRGMISHTYFALGKPLQFLADFHIHFDSVGNGKTTVTITVVKPQVYKGYEGRGMHGGLLLKREPVEPTTVEEYQLLRHFGLILDEKDMPEVIFPI